MPCDRSGSQPVPEPTFTIGGDLAVRRLGYGAMRLTPWSGPPADRDAAAAVLREAVELGVQLIDTADFYGLGSNEELLADALHPYPDELTIATKVGAVRASSTDWTAVGRPEYLRQQAELCLRRLRVERIDLLQLHCIDPLVPLADQVGALRQLQDEGKVRHLGLSNVNIGQLEQARRLVDVASVQNPYSVLERGQDAVLERCAHLGIAFLPWRPVAGGQDSVALRAVAGELGATPAQVALAWLLHRSPVLLPIPGTTRPEHLRDNVAASELSLTDDQLRRLAAG